MSTRAVHAQYERFPYPPVPWLALPKSSQGTALKWETGARLRDGTPTPHHDIRILVVGCGTLEASVVLQQHPQAAHITAIDLSRNAISISKKRCKALRWRNTLQPWQRRGPVVEHIAGDIWQHHAEPYDYIIATHVLQHVEDGAALLQHLTTLLRPTGLLRISTYPVVSRLWVYALQQWFQNQGLSVDSPNLKKQAHQIIATFDSEHPARQLFQRHDDRLSTQGMVDAFFHICDRPHSPYYWACASANAKLRLLGESQHETAQSHMLCELSPKLTALDPWQGLQLLDDCAELSCHPILWLTPGMVEPQAMPQPEHITSVAHGYALALERTNQCCEKLGMTMPVLLSRLQRHFERPNRNVLLEHWPKLWPSVVDPRWDLPIDLTV